MSLESLNDTQTSSLNTALEQMKRKREVISQLNTRISELITTPEELEEVILEGEEFQDTLLERIHHVEKFLEKLTTQPVPPPLLSMSSTTQAVPVSEPSNSTQNVPH